MRGDIVKPPLSRYHFYWNEGHSREPLHVHVTSGTADAKFWLLPTAAVAYNRGFSARMLAGLLRVVEARRDEIERAWNEHFS